jgi:hypothetical protein
LRSLPQLLFRKAAPRSALRPSVSLLGAKAMAISAPKKCHLQAQKKETQEASLVKHSTTLDLAPGSYHKYEP